MAATDTLLTPNPKRLSDGDRPPGLFTDRVFRFIAFGAALTVLVVLALIIVSTTNEAWPWFRDEGLGVFGRAWNPAAGDLGALGLIAGTLTVAGAEAGLAGIASGSEGPPPGGRFTPRSLPRRGATSR